MKIICPSLAVSAAPRCADIREVVSEDLVQEPLARHADTAAEPIELVEGCFVDEPRASYTSLHGVSLRGRRVPKWHR
jgi:hypothetical protein